MTPIKTGAIVTAKGEGMPWVGLITETDFSGATWDAGEYVSVQPIGADDRDYDSLWSPNSVRPLTDPEILALGAFLCTGDAGAEWDFFRDGSILLGPDWLLRETALDLDVWTITKKGSQDALYIGTAPTDRARRLEACKALIRHCAGVK